MTYDPNLPTPRDRIRFTLGDTQEPPLRPDTEYDALLDQFTETEALVKMAESLASEYAQNPSSVSVGGISVSYSSLVKTWSDIAKSARDALAAAAVSGGFVSGIVDRGDMSARSTAEYRRGLDDFPDGAVSW